jgi:hypothetical protein
MPVTVSNPHSHYTTILVESGRKKESILKSEIMADSPKVERLHLWISYPWISKEERDFSYLVGQLRDSGIEAAYDSLPLMPDAHLWERAVQRLLSVGIDGWLYILTHQCFTRRTCTDELAAAISQALKRMGPDFPMIGLLYGIASQHVPPMLRVRPCVSLGDPDWNQQISQVLRHHTAKARKGVEETSFIWQVHTCYCDNPSMTAVEVRSKEESVEYWRFAIPKSAQTIRWGQGPSGGHEISHIRFAEAQGSGKYGNREITWFGAANIISKTESAYAVFAGPLPDFICFGPATSPFGPPSRMEMFWTALSGKAADQADIRFAGSGKSL